MFVARGGLFFTVSYRESMLLSATVPQFDTPIHCIVYFVVHPERNPHSLAV